MVIKRIWIISAVCLLGIIGAAGCMDTAYAVAPPKSTYDAFPPFMANTPPPLVMLVMGKNHKLFYEAYNDASDLDGDGKIDVGYKPDKIDYYGYFDSYKSYSYSSSSGQFNPVAVISDKKVGHGSGLWSGDFLNYLTTSRMDAIRKVLYGGHRVIDSASETVLERAYIPQDAHSWGKEYESIARDGYDIRDYAPLDLPVSTPTQTRHLFASTSLYPPTNSNYKPLLRVLNDSPYRIWEWVSIEHPVAGTKCLDGTNGPNCAHGGGATWMTVPDDTSMGISNVTQTFYDSTGASHPTTHAEYDALVATYTTPPANLQGTQSVSTINGSGDPFDPNPDANYYMDLFNGTLNIPTSGTYTFSVDGDDAVEFLVDINGDGDFDDSGEVVAGWYGGHGKCNCDTHTGSVTLTAGSYTFQYRHEEGTGSDNYYLRWQVDTPASAMTDYRVRVKVAEPGLLETNCKQYPDGNYKPTGLLQRNGETNSMYFGLISGSYDHNTSGGILRKKMGSITDEIDPDNGVFTSVNGIIKTIDRFRIIDYNYSGYQYNGGWVTTRAMQEGEFPDWGNPVGEMMYEALRYFAGKKSPTSAYSSGAMSDDASLGLPTATWDDPYDAATGFPSCSKPFMLVISDINPTFDSDQLPGSAFGSFSGDLAGLNVTSLGQAIGSEEGIAGNYYIGDNGGATDSSCSAKTLSGLGDIRGLCPEEPTKQGSYYSASVAYHGHTQDISAASGNQNVGSYMVGMASPLPRISIMVGNQPMTMVPFAKSVGGCLGVDPNIAFQPTNQIVDFYVDTLDPDDPTYGKFRINYEDVEQGADHDMDAIVEYTFQVYQSDGVTPAVTAADGTNNGTLVKVTLQSTYAAGCIIQHIGYIISGTTADGTYLEVRDLDTSSSGDVDYHLDTPNVAGALPTMTTRTFYPGTDTAASLLKDPFWYAAKWGSFNDSNGNGVPDVQSEWDKDLDGVPDAYFYVTNPLRLEQQLSRSFAEILSKTSSGTAAAVVANNSEGQGTMLQAFFKPSYVTQNNEQLSWVGYLRSLWVDQFGHLREDSNHDFKFNYKTDKIIEYGTDGNGNAFVKRYTKHYHYNPDNEFDEQCVVSDCTTAYETIGVEDIETLFAAGEMLHQESADSRNIFTFIDGNGLDDDGDGNIDESGEVEGAMTVGQVAFPFSDTYNDVNGEVVKFSTDTANLLKPFLGLEDNSAFSYLETGTPDQDTRVANLINYIRGVDSSGLVGQPLTRNRTVDGKVWKLGDIVRSTPVSVAAPIDNYDLIYSDESYLDFLKKYAGRETVVYAGANDGMLHAFTHGKYTLDTSSGEYGYEPVGGTPIGQELWAYIPQSLLPQLKWLADPDYGHSFYVDQKPKVFDARIFTPDDDHPNGWGTLLLVGLGAGGKRSWADGDFDHNSGTLDVRRWFDSSYFCMDVTNPRSPRLLWERSYDNLGLTTSFPAVMQVGAVFNDSKGTWSGGKWYAVMGSGPHDNAGKSDYNGYSDQNGYIFVVDLATGNLLRSFDTNWPNAVMASAVGLDKGSDEDTGPVRGLTYNVDAVYIGGAGYTGTGSDFTGKMFKINTRYPADVPSDNPNDWSLSTLFDSDRPISAAPTLTVDKQDNAWVLFGTGRFQEMNDRVTTQQQYLYGLKDPYFNKQYDSSDSTNYNGLGNYYHNNGSALTLTRSRLFYSNPYESFDNTGTVSGGLSYISDWDTLLGAVRNTDQADHSDYFDGWYRALDPRPDVTLPSERVISKPALLGGVMFTPVYIPDDDICGFGGSTDIYGVYYETGTPMWRHIFNTTTATPGGSVAYRAGTLMNTGPPPPTVSLHTGRQSGAKIFTQTGLGPVLEVNANIDVPASDVLYWNEPIQSTPAPAP
jgi:type IV pilus assembly protein PilY1